MKTAVIYARYSSDKQTEQSIEGQLRVCNEFAQRNNIIIVDNYIDRAISGKTDNRDAFQRMLKDSNKHAWDYVIVYRLDRFSRNKYEAAIHKKTLKDNGIKLLSAMENIPDTPEGIILESLLEGMAEYYSAELAQKVKRGMNESLLKGNFTGGCVLYGYKLENKKILIDQDKANIIIDIFENYAAGIYVKDIIENLTKNGILNNGKPFARTTIYNMLKNEKYAGLYKYDGKVYDNIYPRIVPENLFEVVRKKVEENSFGKHNPDVVYLLKHKVKCGTCGKNIISESGTSKSGDVKRYYKCAGRKAGSKCSKSMIRKEFLEKIVVETTFKIFDNAQTVSKIADKILEFRNKRLEDESKLRIFSDEKEKITKAINNLLNCMEQGIVTNATKQRLEQLEKTNDEIDQKILAEKTKRKIQISKADIMKYIRTSLKKEPKQLIKLLIDKIILFDDKVEIYYNYIDKKQSPDRNNRDFSLLSETYEIIVDEKKFKTEPSMLKLTVDAFI